MKDVAVIAIGRNEGQRLRRCLETVCGRGLPVIYVDSDSIDGSVELARSLGADIVQLDASLPLCAALARNAGLERLSGANPQTRFIQFVDGDCEIADGWIDRARAQFEDRPDVAVVCGRRRERRPDASIYNRLADLEWNTPIGEVQSCGGDAMMRVEAIVAVGGFDPSVIAGEEPELCQRLRGKGWKILRIDAPMTTHDAAMTRFGQWWRRAVRGGYGAMDVATRFGSEGLFASQVRSARIWAAGWPVMVVAAALTGGSLGGMVWAILAGALTGMIVPAQILRLALQSRHRTGSTSDALAYGAFTLLGKWPSLMGQIRYARDRASGKAARTIEYKPHPAAQSS